MVYRALTAEDRRNVVAGILREREIEAVRAEVDLAIAGQAAEVAAENGTAEEAKATADEVDAKVDELADHVAGLEVLAVEVAQRDELVEAERQAEG